MKKRIIRKCRSQAGETIGETLVALLISALALIMLAGAIGSAADIVTRNKAAMDTYFETGQQAIRDGWTEKVEALE